MSTLRRLGITLALLALAAATPALADESVEVAVKLTPRSVPVGGTAQLTIQMATPHLRLPAATPTFELHNLRLVGGPSRSERLQFGSSGIHRSLTLIWHLAPLAPGIAKVTKIRVSVGGRTLQLPDQALTVRPRRGGPSGGSPEALRRGRPTPRSGFQSSSPEAPVRNGRESLPAIFLRAEVVPPNPYVGERATWRLLLYSRRDITGATPRELPTFDGFWVEEVELPDPRPARPVRVRGQRYSLLVLLERTLYPLEPGTHRLAPAQFDLRAESALARFLGPLISDSEEVRLSSNRVSVEVRPLPSAPPDFRGLVGAVQLEASLDPRELQAGEAATFSVQLSGAGPIDTMDPPTLPPLEGVRIFPAQPDLDGHLKSRGSRTWKWLLVPESAGYWRVPSLRIPYFEPQSAAYRTATTEPLELTATPAPQPEPEPPRKQAAELTSDSVGWWWLPVLAAAALLGVVLPMWHRRRRSLSAAEHHHFLDALERARSADRARQAAREMEAGWRHLLEERGEIAPRMPRQQWLCQLGSAGWEQQKLDEMEAILRDLEYLRAAPELASAEEIRDEAIQSSWELVANLPHS